MMLVGAGLLRRFGARLLSVLLIATLAWGCRTFRSVPPSAGGLHESIRPGDALRVVMRDGTEVYLTVTAITSEALEGEVAHGWLQGSRRITLPFADIATVQRSEVSAAKTAAGTLLGAVAAVAVTGLVFLLWALSNIPGAAEAPGHAVPASSPRR